MIVITNFYQIAALQVIRVQLVKNTFLFTETSLLIPNLTSFVIYKSLKLLRYKLFMYWPKMSSSFTKAYFLKYKS
jgi:hypothetical protein